MVEFGAKLADNRTAEWVDSYMQYEKLKQILTRCKGVNKRYTELEEKYPEIAKFIKTESSRGVLPASIQSLEDMRNAEAAAAAAAAASTTGHADAGKTESMNTANTGVTTSRSYNSLEEAVALLKKSDGSIHSGGGGSDYGSVNSASKTAAASDTASQGLGSIITRVHSGVSDYFDERKKYERQFRGVLRELKKVSFEFESNLVADIDRVNRFYNEKLKELNDRLDFLYETVELSRISNNGDNVEGVKDNDAEYGEDERIPSIHDQKHDKRIVDSTHISTKIGYRKPKTDKLGLDLDADDDLAARKKSPQKKKQEKHANIREADSIQRALVDQYRTAKLLHNFAIMNYTGFVKIVKKHDKVNSEHQGRYRNLISPKNICDEGKAVEAMAERIEQLYAKWFCQGNRSEAIVQLLPKRGDGLEMDWSQLRLGYRMGMCTILGLWVCWDCVWGLLSEHSSTIGSRTAFPVFRACGGLLFLQWFWGMSVWVWTRYRVNYIYLFDLNPTTVQSPLSIFNSAVDNTLVFLLSMLLYYKAGAHDIPGKMPAGVFPVLLIGYAVFQLIFPLKTRMPMWANIGKVVTAPIHSPTFFHGYIGDIFTSMVKVFQDLAWTFFFVFSGDWMVNEDLPGADRHSWAKARYYRNILIPILTLAPLLIRFNQCLRRYADTGKRLPHLANAFKYALSQTVTLFGAFHPLYLDHNRHRDTNIFQAFWMTAFIGSSMYSFWWDIYMDWGLGRPDYNFLGPRLMYPRKSMYYAIMSLDLVLRFAWVLTLIPPDTGASFALPHYLTAVSMILELYRRTVWGFLRLENEHRSNTAGFRRVGFVPLHFSTGHMHAYNQEKEQRGFKVLIEIVVITIFVLGACTVSVVAAQRATEKTTIPDL